MRRRASHHVTLVLVSAALVMHGCDHEPSTLGPPRMSEPPVGTMPDTLPGTQPATYQYVPPHYYNQSAHMIYPPRTNSGSSSGYRSSSYRSSSIWGGSSWGSSGSSGSSSSGSSKSSSSVSRGGFGSSSHSSFSSSS